MSPGGVEAPKAANVRYRCMDGSKLAVRFDYPAGTAAVSRDGQALGVLVGQKPASGIWYKTGPVELRGKGDAATFTRPGQPPIACTAIR
jgi:hypothetical protein